MATSAQKSSLIALSAACTAMAAAAQALAASFDETITPAPAEPAKPVPPKKKTPPAVKPADPAPAAVAPAAAPAAAPATNGAAPDLITQCRTAAKSYAEVYGREGLKEILGKYTQGTLADVAAEKLPELLEELS